MVKRLIITLCLISLFSSVRAQDYSQLSDAVAQYPDITKLLPPLRVLLDSAEMNSPMLKFYDADIIISNLKVKIEKRDWMRYLGFEGGVRYGLLDNVVFSSYFGQNMNNFNSETRYNVGLFVKIPIMSLVDKSGVKMSRQEVEKSKQLHERTLNELRQLVIVQYNNLIKSHRSLRIRFEHVATYEVQMLRAEQDFLNGNIPISEYSRLNEMLTTSKLNLEENKIEFITAFQLLQEVVGMELHLKP